MSNFEFIQYFMNHCNKKIYLESLFDSSKNKIINIKENQNHKLVAQLFDDQLSNNNSLTYKINKKYDSKINNFSKKLDKVLYSNEYNFKFIKYIQKTFNKHIYIEYLINQNHKIINMIDIFNHEVLATIDLTSQKYEYNTDFSENHNFLNNLNQLADNNNCVIMNPEN